MSFFALQQQYFLFKRQIGTRNAGPIAPIASVLPSLSRNGSYGIMSGARGDFMPTPESGETSASNRNAVSQQSPDKSEEANMGLMADVFWLERQHVQPEPPGKPRNFPFSIHVVRYKLVKGPATKN